MRVCKFAALAFSFGLGSSLLLVPTSSSHLAGAAAKVFEVNSTRDATDRDPGDGKCDTGLMIEGRAECTLRAAIQEANAVPGADTIMLPTGIYKLTIPGADEDQAATGDLDITDDLTIVGVGADRPVIDADRLDRIFDTPPRVGAPEIEVILEGLTVRNGRAAGGCRGGFLRSADGGGIRYAYNLHVISSIISDNVATCTGGGLAAALDSNGFPVRLSLTDSIVRNNHALGVELLGAAGGGIDAKGSTSLTVTRSSIVSNSAGSGGGINITGIAEPALLTDVTVHDNKALRVDIGGGGGIDAVDIIIKRSTISSNFAFNVGGGIRCTNCQITNSTISGNTSGGGTFPSAGGGIATPGTLLLTHVTVAFNRSDAGSGIFTFGISAHTTLRNTIIANAPDNCGGNGALTSDGNNLASDASCNLTNPGDLPSTDPKLDPVLRANLGPTLSAARTLTHRLLRGSPAINAGRYVGVGEDQRGCPRPGARPIISRGGLPIPPAGRPDIGAFEVGFCKPVEPDALPLRPDDLRPIR